MLGQCFNLTNDHEKIIQRERRRKKKEKESLTLARRIPSPTPSLAHMHSNTLAILTITVFPFCSPRTKEQRKKKKVKERKNYEELCGKNQQAAVTSFAKMTVLRLSLSKQAFPFFSWIIQMWQAMAPTTRDCFSLSPANASSAPSVVSNLERKIPSHKN